MECLGLVANYRSRTKNKPDLKFEEKVEIIKKLIHPKQYINFKEKQNFIIEMLKKIITYSDTEKLQYCSCEKYVIFIKNMLSIYTDLRIDEYSYDILCSNELLDIIVASLGTEYNICLGIMEMYIEDLEHKRIDLRKM